MKFGVILLNVMLNPRSKQTTHNVSSWSAWNRGRQLSILIINRGIIECGTACARDVRDAFCRRVGTVACGSRARGGSVASVPFFSNKVEYPLRGFSHTVVVSP